jgi:biopolymer transport protein ExbD
MITRPLELASRLRAEPRSLDWLFFVNVGLLALFFALFGSRFVLAPGVPVGFRLPTVPKGEAALAVTTHRISVAGPNLMFVNDGAINSQKDLEAWLEREAKKTKHPSLLILMSADVPNVVFVDISRAASRAGFEGVYLGTQEATAVGGR